MNTPAKHLSPSLGKEHPWLNVVLADSKERGPQALRLGDLPSSNGICHVFPENRTQNLSSNFPESDAVTTLMSRPTSPLLDMVHGSEKESGCYDRTQSSPFRYRVELERDRLNALLAKDAQIDAIKQQFEVMKQELEAMRRELEATRQHFEVMVLDFEAIKREVYDVTRD